MNAIQRTAKPAFVAAMIFGIVLCVPESASAQFRRDREDFGIGRDYINGIRRLVERVERDSNSFREYYEKREREGRGREGGYENLKRQIQRFDESAEDLRKHLGRSDYWLDTRTQVQDLIHHARPIDRAMSDRGRFSPSTVDRWRRVATELNALAILMAIGRI